MGRFNYKEDNSRLISNIRIKIILIITLVVVITIIRSCFKTIDFREVSIEKQIDNNIIIYDINKPFKELNITTQKEFNDYLHWLVDNYLEPKEYSNLIDWNNPAYRLKGMSKWDNCENGVDLINKHIKWRVYEELIKRIVNRGYDWSILPLSSNFKKKFNGIDIPTYYGFLDKDDIIDNYLDIGKRIYVNSADSESDYFYLSYYTGNGDEQDLICFKKYMTKDGYLDNVELEKIDHMLDANRNYIIKEDSLLMNNERSIDIILKKILPDDGFNNEEGNEGFNPYSSPYYFKNVIAETGMTNDFRNYYNSLNGKGILPKGELVKIINDGNSDQLKIDNIDIDNCSAIAICVLKSKKIVKYYDIHWTTDEEYRLDSLEVKFNREEILSVTNN